MKSNLILVISILFVLASSCKEDKTKVIVNSLDDETVVLDSLVPTVSTSTFLALSDIHLNDTDGMVYYGSTSGDSIWDRTKKQINEVSKNSDAKFMVYLGDLPNYDTNITHNIGTLLKDFRRLDGDFPILYLPGNNDTMNGDYHSFQLGEKPDSTKTIFSLDKNPLNPWPVIDRHSKTVTVGKPNVNEEFGFYDVELVINGEKLNIMALNSVIFCHKGGHNYYKPDDGVLQGAAAQIQFSWIEKTLDSYAATDNVLLLMHIPPGTNGYGKYGESMWNDMLNVNDKNGNLVNLQSGFLDILKHNQSKVRGILTGHTHYDGLRRLYAAKDNSNPSDMVAVSVSTPGISVNHGNNPGFKIFEFNSATFDLIDFTTYYAEPIAKTGRYPYNDFNFKYQSKSYSFKGNYSVTDKSATIFSAIKAIKDTAVINSKMRQVLAVNSENPNVLDKFYCKNALDVLYQ